jgi:ABC-type nitrate/sulfonate/bicarbonate transport system substrate-binding protein
MTFISLGAAGSLLGLAAALGVAASSATAAEPTLVRVNTFPTARSLPFYAGLAKSIFTKHGLKVEVVYTENSERQRAGLTEGKSDIVHAALDNAVAMIEVAKQDVVIVAGGDSGTNEFYVQPEVKSFADMRGRTLVVDAPDTAYALVAKKILLQHGLKEGADYTVKPIGRGSMRLQALADDKQNAGAILNLPYSIQAEKLGLKSLGRPVDLLGPYQAGGVFVMRAWAQRNGETLERYLAAYVVALRWALDPANRAEAVAMLVSNLKLPPDVAERTYQLLSEPDFGFAPEARLNLAGFRNMLALRAEIEQPGATLPPPERYLDLGYYERALQRLGRR